MATPETSKRTLASPSHRLEAVPAYMFAELERRVAEKRQAGVDVISLGIGDPDRATFPHIVEAMQNAVADPANHRYPDQSRPRGVPRRLRRASTPSASGSRSIPSPR